MSNIGLVLILCITIFTPAITLAHFTAVQYTPAPLSGSEIRSTLFGKLVTGEYPSGARWTERFNADGSSDYSEGGRITRGIMTIYDNILCFSYREKSQTGGCFEVWQRGPNCFDFYSLDGNGNLDSRRFGRNWQARGWVDNQPSTCLSDKIS